jgi:Fic family protein
MINTKTVKLFKTNFLSEFIFSPSLLPFKDKEITDYDQKLSKFEQVFLNPEVERNLISKNELLSSFAISKAEFSQLTFKEAQAVYQLVLDDPNYLFIRTKIKNKKPLTQKDHDKLEFFNIAKTFRALNNAPFKISDLSPEFLLNLHKQLTQGMDIFQKHLSGFSVYHSGEFRNNDGIFVGSYRPAPYKEIEAGLHELIEYLKNYPTPTNVALFHTTLYALHPFNNGNKRVCRVIEHLLLRALGLNKKNLYSTSYYYHQEKARYYKYLLYSLERRNLNHFVSFVQESIRLSQLSVIKTSLEAKRNQYLYLHVLDTNIRSIVKPLIKRRELQFKHLYKRVHRKMARQTFVNYLQKAVSNKLVIKREKGRSTYYRLNIQAPEEKFIKEWVAVLKRKLSYIPEKFCLT